MREAAAEADRVLCDVRLEARALHADVERLEREKGDVSERLEATKVGGCVCRAGHGFVGDQLHTCKQPATSFDRT